METLREEWEWLQSEESAPYRERYDAYFDLMFPSGYKGGMRQSVLAIGGRLVRGGFYLREDSRWPINQIHPDAFDLIAKYGVHYTPCVLTKAPPEPKRDECFSNSRVLALCKSLCYVEGIVVGVRVPPMLHAWNSERNGTIAVDWTHYPVCKWSRYIGIPFTLQERARIIRAAKIGRRTTSIFHRDFFTQEVGRVLHSILKRRRHYRL